MYEDELPDNMTDEEYSQWYENSWVDGVRIGPTFTKDELKEAKYEQMPETNLVC